MTQQKPYRKTKACNIKTFLAFLFTCVFLTTFQSTVCSQGNAEQAPAKRITRFSFSLLTGGIVILRATIGNIPDSLNFVLDTGSGGISLDSTTVDNLKLVAEQSNRTIRGIAGIRKVKYVRDQTLHLPGLNAEHLDFHVNDYEILTSVYGVRIDGIIGYSFLSRYIVKIDYDHLKVEVWEPGKIKYPKRGHILKPVINSIPVFRSKIIDGNNVEADFYFDTGAGLCLLMSEDFANDSSIITKGKRLVLTQAEGLGGKKPMMVTTVKEVRFGPYKFKKVPAHIFKDEFNVTAYPLLGGLLGNDIFRRFNMIINYSAKEIHVAPNTHFLDAFDYSYTGMGIYLVNGAIVIEDVLEGSPAEKAGLKAGDEILGIDKNFTNNIQAYKNLLQTPGKRLRLIVLRDSETVEIKLRVASIL